MHSLAVSDRVPAVVEPRLLSWAAEADHELITPSRVIEGVVEVSQVRPGGRCESGPAVTRSVSRAGVLRHGHGASYLLGVNKPGLAGVAAVEGPGVHPAGCQRPHGVMGSVVVTEPRG